MIRTSKDRFKNIRLLLLDVDGVLTDGKITYNSFGDEIKSFDVKDGLGLQILSKNGFEIGIVSGRTSEIVVRRAKELGIEHVFQGVQDKWKVVFDFISERNILPEEVAFMGDDLPDLCVLERVGLACCPENAVKQVKNVCHWVSSKTGGNGAVRELCELLLLSR